MNNTIRKLSFWSRFSLELPTERVVLGHEKTLPFRVVTDSSFGGTSTGRFEEGRFFRGELVGSNPFVALRARLPEDDSFVADFEGFSLRVRSRTCHRFSFNLQTPALIPQDLYQAFMVLPEPGKFFEMVLPFENMLLTGRGRPREIQRKLDSRYLKTIGLSVGGEHAEEGAFELEIDWIKWVREVNGSRAPIAPVS